jgi:hypothetical protein
MHHGKNEKVHHKDGGDIYSIYIYTYIYIYIYIYIYAYFEKSLYT